MRDFATPVVAGYGSSRPGAPLVVLLHGRGSSEQNILGLAPSLPSGPEYVAVRAPIVDGDGHTWFASRSVGRLVAESLRSTMDWFTEWLDDVAPEGRPVFLIGFSAGAAFAGGLILDRPERYAGAAILYGTLPFDAGIPVTAGQLAGMATFVVHGEHDVAVPRELLQKTWDYLTGESGATVKAVKLPDGHGVSDEALAQLGLWLATELA